MNLSNNNIGFISAFVGGVVLSFTPCAYPLIPVVAGYIGIRTGRSKWKSLVLCFVYVTGIAVTYSLLGVIASLTGRLFGGITSNPWFQIGAGIMILVFGLSMFDFFILHVPLLRKHHIKSDGGYISTLVFGISSGLIISPCTTPVLGTILLHLSAKRDIMYGALLLLVFAYGMGLVLILAGTFGSVIAQLPKSGKWMVYVKKMYAFILMAMGVYFICAAIGRF